MANVVLGVSGGIAAYKAAELVRLLVKQKHTVHVVMTAAAQRFVTPLTFQALSGNAVHTDLLDPQAEAGMGHIELARWAEVILVAPASADILARMAHGMADDLLATLILASEALVCVAPAMNRVMWQHPATQSNVHDLRARGVNIWGPGKGEQACGEVGPGRMLEPEQLIEHVHGLLARTTSLKGRMVLITAGPTREPIDPVRYLTNHSSGKMGYALAHAASSAGAEVVLVSGPTQIPCPKGVNRIAVDTAAQMLQQCLAYVERADVFIGAAAVADFRVDAVAEHKIKKSSEATSWALNLVQNPDVLATVAGSKTGLFSVGFAAETENVIDNARLKLAKKQVNMIVANNVAQQGIGFNSDDNEVTVVTANGQHVIAKQSKEKIAKQLISLIAEQLHNN